MSDWNHLREELDAWSEAGKIATFWWRDDDAAAPTPQLESLLRHAQSVPLCVAVIPALATPRLAERLRDVPSIAVLQHGWAHANHAVNGKSEYPASRSEEEVGRELAAGRRILESYFGSQCLPVFAPPWHAFDDRFLPLLPQNGIVRISRIGPRANRLAARGLVQLNAHIGTLKWTAPPSFAGEVECLSSIVDHLHGRRTGRYDSIEPTGLLTHHLVQDDKSYEFISRLIEVTSGHAAATWLNGGDVFNRSATRD